jgi:hypothetical protein
MHHDAQVGVMSELLLLSIIEAARPRHKPREDIAPLEKNSTRSISFCENAA